jgi:phage FluMu protein Com
MLQRIRCKECNSLVEYDNRSIVEGNRDFENINCPKCGTYLTRVFTDLIPSVQLVDESE